MVEDASDRPLHGASAEQISAFTDGDALFGLAFRPSDGLGPLYIRSACAACHAHGARVKTQVEQLLVAFQFQDRVQQIVDQVQQSMQAAVAALAAAAREGRQPAAAEWQKLLSAGYTTDEQRNAGSRTQTAAPVAGTETTFF